MDTEIHMVELNSPELCGGSINRTFITLTNLNDELAKALTYL